MLTVLEEALENNPTEVNLFLQGVTIGEVGAVTVLRHLRSHENLTLLELRGSSIGSKGAEYLATGLVSHLRLKHLGLGRNGLGSKGALHIIKGLITQTENLAVYSDSPASGGQGLETLDLESNMLQDSVGPSLGDLIMKSKSLVALSLEKNDMRMDGATFIANALKHPTTMLRNLNLGQNRCGMAAGLFGEALKINRTLLTLNLASNGVYPDSAKSIIEALGVNDVLKSVNLQHNQAIDALASAESKNSPKASANSPTAFGNGPLPVALNISPNLRELNLFGNRLQTSLAPAVAASLRTATGLIALSVGRCSVNGVAMVPILASIATLVHLSTLDLVGCGLSLSTAKPLANVMVSLPNLGTLLLDENRLAEDGSMIIAEALTGCSALTNLSMDSCGITPKGALELGRALVHRRGLGFVQLHFASNSIDNEGMVAILDALCYHVENANLEIVDIHSNAALSGRVTGTLAKLLDLHPKLGTVNIKDTVLSENTGVHFMNLEEAKYYATEYSSVANVKPPAHIMEKPGEVNKNSNSRSGSPGGGRSGKKTLTRAEAALAAKAALALDASVPTQRSNFNGTSAAWIEGAPVTTTTAGMSPPKTTRLPGSSPPSSTAMITRKGSEERHEGDGSTTATPRLAQMRLTQGDESYIPGLAPGSVPVGHRRHQLHDIGQNIEQFPVTEMQLRKQFSLLDTSGDGVLQRAEFEHYFKSLQLVECDPHSFRRISELVGKFCDKSGRLSFEGFSIVMLRLTNM